MTKDADWVELTTAKSAFEAELLVGALREMDLSAVTFGGLLADEYTLSQTILGLRGGIQVMVPNVQLERAQQALSELKRKRSPSD